MARWAQWLVSLAALALIGESLGSYFYHRRQLEAIAVRHLRLVVTGPGQLQPAAGAAFTLQTTRATGEPWSVPAEWSLSSSAGKHVDRTDNQGRLVMRVPAEMAKPSVAATTVQLNVSAGDSDNAVAITLPLAIQQLQKATDRLPRSSDTAEDLRSIYDNASEVRKQYDASLGNYRAHRAQVVIALVMLAFFGGLALALLLTMLAVLRIVWGGQLWLPALMAAICCTVVTTVAISMGRMRALEAGAVPVANSTPPPRAAATPTLIPLILAEMQAQIR
jgi:hypothetical protein